MARYLWCSFMGTLAPSMGQPKTEPNRPLNHTEGDEPLSDEERRGAVSRAALESRETTPDPIIIMQPRGLDLDEGDLASQIAVRRNVPLVTTEGQDPTLPKVPETTGVEGSENGILEDDKLYQDAAIKYCNAYEMLEHKCAEQVCLMEEASGALLAAETQASEKQQELIDLQGRHEVEIKSAIDKALTPYVCLEEQLTSANNNLQAKDKAVKKLKEQVCALESSLANQTELPSVRQPWEEIDLHREVFNYVPGTVNTRRGAVTYESQDQALPFHRNVCFGDRSTVPDLKVDGGSSNPAIPQNHPAPHSLTPSHDPRPLEKIYDVSQITPPI